MRFLADPGTLVDRSGESAAEGGGAASGAAVGTSVGAVAVGTVGF
jgi:hypothetical protein